MLGMIYYSRIINVKMCSVLDGMCEKAHHLMRRFLEV